MPIHRPRETDPSNHPHPKNRVRRAGALALMSVAGLGFGGATAHASHEVSQAPAAAAANLASKEGPINSVEANKLRLGPNTLTLPDDPGDINNYPPSFRKHMLYQLKFMDMITKKKTPNLFYGGIAILATDQRPVPTWLSTESDPKQRPWGWLPDSDYQVFVDCLIGRDNGHVFVIGRRQYEQRFYHGIGYTDTSDWAYDKDPHPTGKTVMDIFLRSVVDITDLVNNHPEQLLILGHPGDNPGLVKSTSTKDGYLSVPGKNPWTRSGMVWISDSGDLPDRMERESLVQVPSDQSEQAIKQILAVK